MFDKKITCHDALETGRTCFRHNSTGTRILSLFSTANFMLQMAEWGVDIGKGVGGHIDIVCGATFSSVLKSKTYQIKDCAKSIAYFCAQHSTRTSDHLLSLLSCLSCCHNVNVTSILFGAVSRKGNHLGVL